MGTKRKSLNRCLLPVCARFCFDVVVERRRRHGEEAERRRRSFEKGGGRPGRWWSEKKRFGGRLCVFAKAMTMVFGHRRRRPIIGKSPQRRDAEDGRVAEGGRARHRGRRASFRGEKGRGGGGGGGEEENGLGGVVSDAAAFGLFESGIESNEKPTKSSRPEPGPLDVARKKNDDERKHQRSEESSEGLEKNGLVFLKSVVPGTCAISF